MLQRCQTRSIVNKDVHQKTNDIYIFYILCSQDVLKQQLIHVTDPGSRLSAKNSASAFPHTNQELAATTRLGHSKTTTTPLHHNRSS